MKAIPQYPAYSIDEAGTVIVNNMPNRRRNTITIGNQLINGKESGYKYVTLLSGSIPKRIAVHRLVAFTYVDNPDNLPEVNHKDRNKSNNHYTNLEWCSHQDNIIHSFGNGRTVPKGADHWLYGTKVSKSTKQLMRAAKVGTKHPKFKGYYIVHHKRYTSSIEAEKATKIDRKTILNRCKKGAQGTDYYFLAMEWAN